MKLLSILILLSITTTVLALVILSFPWRHPLLTNLHRIDKVIRPSCPPARLYLPDSLFC